MADVMVSFKELAARLRMDRSHANKYAKKAAAKLGIQIGQWRDPTANNQVVLAVTEQDAERIVEYRRSQGFLESDKVPATDTGLFYVVQLVPELDPSRIKLGFTTDMNERLSQHRTAAPTSAVLKTWPCRRAWETTVIDCLVCAGCKLILNEVYECPDIAALLDRGDELFQLLPDPRDSVDLSDGSPLLAREQ